jgi:O-methyltransferase involved in polyketide biosynthesis
LQFDTIGQRFAVAVDFQDCLSPIHVGRVDYHLVVKTAWSQQGLIRYLGPIGGGQEDMA